MGPDKLHYVDRYFYPVLFGGAGIALFMGGLNWLNHHNSPEPTLVQLVEKCRKAKPGDTASGIVFELGGDYSSPITITNSLAKAPRHTGTLVGAGGLVHNLFAQAIGPEGYSDGDPIFEPSIDEVCVLVEVATEDNSSR